MPEHSTAIAYFAFARPGHTAASIASLAANEGASETPLYVFADAPRCSEEARRVAEVRAILDGITGFNSVRRIYRQGNLGCAANIISGITTVMHEHDRVVVVEDDLLLSPHFLKFMKQALAVYRDRKDIISISAASPPSGAVAIPEHMAADVYLAPRSVPWGWATWRDRWLAVDWQITGFTVNRWRPTWRRRMARGGNDLLPMLADQMAGRIDSWNVRFNHAQAMAGLYSLYPRYSYVRNAGLDGSGLHCREADRYEVDLGLAVADPRMPRDIQPDPDLMRAVKGYHDEHPVSLVLGAAPGMRRLIRAVKRRLGADRPLLKRPG